MENFADQGVCAGSVEQAEDAGNTQFAEFNGPMLLEAVRIPSLRETSR
jgi:hypothetical protein